MSESVKINRVLELDMNTERNPHIRIRIIVQTPHRPGEIIPHGDDSKADLIVVREAALAAILHAEADGTFKKGEAMKKFIEGLQDGYVDVTTEIKDTRMDDRGNILKKDG